MKYLKTYEFFDFLRKRLSKEYKTAISEKGIEQYILDECYDILLELSDKGYHVEVNDETKKLGISLDPDIEPGDIYILVSTKEEKLEDDFFKKKLYDKYYYLYDNEIEPVINRVKEYLSEKGFVPTTKKPPRFISHQSLVYRFYFKNKITASAVAR